MRVLLLLALASAAAAAEVEVAALRGADEEALMGGEGRELKKGTKAPVVYPTPSEPRSVSGAYTPEEEEESEDEVTGQGTANHPVCYKVASTWWGTRLAQKTRALVTNMDTECQRWDQMPEQCNVKSSRSAYSGSSTTAEMNALCSTVGAHDHRCLANPCNSLNTGDCTVQGSQGQCVWWWGKNYTEYNKFLVSQGRTPLPSHGCYRNPCNMPGYGRQQQACPLRSAPGLFTCTWCKGAGDPTLDGLGVGCQMTVPTTGASCAPVNNKAVAKPSVVMSVSNKRCQCSTDYAVCQALVDDSRSSWVNRY
jgi:hypothetical protein